MSRCKWKELFDNNMKKYWKLLAYGAQRFLSEGGAIPLRFSYAERFGILLDER